VQRAKRARSRTFKAGSGHSKGIPLRIPNAATSLPPSHNLNISTLQHEVLRSGVAHFFFTFFWGALPLWGA